MIEEIMEDLLLFVDPDIGQELDLERGFEFLDKELAEMYPEPGRSTNTRVVDKLVKVFLRDGTERWMLLHIEVQGKNDKNFARRMFEYYIRIFGKHERPVAAIAVLTGKNGNRMATAYEDKCLWMRTRYEYKTLVITDYSDEMLRSSTNPFAAVILVAKEALLRVKGANEDLDEALLEQKLLMVKLLKERMAVYGRKKTAAILMFLNNYVIFKNQKTNRNFMQKADRILGKTNTMGILEQLAEIKHQEGIQEGLGKAVRGLLKKTDFSARKIAELVGVPLSLVNKIKRTLKEGT